MKPRGRHPDKALSAVRVRAISEPGRYADGNGLYLVVDPSGAKRWVLRTVVRGKRRDIGLGGLRVVSLAEAREQALAYRKLARNGGDPLAERRKERRPIPTFEEAARAVHAEHSAAWRNAKHSAQWINTLVQYVLPTMGDRRVDQIETPDVLRVLAPIWLTRPETARRVRQRIGAVLDWAKAAGFREGENPVAGVAKGLPRQPDRKAHHAALPYAEVPGFLAALHEVDIGLSARLAFEFLVLTATRTSEVLAARWDEIDARRRDLDDPARAHEDRAAAQGPAVAALPGDPRRCEGAVGRQPLRLSGPISRQAAVEHGLPDDAAAHGPRRDGARVPIVVPGLGVRADELPARGVRAGAWPQREGQDGGRLPAGRPARQAARAHGGVGGVREVRAADVVSIEIAKK